MLTNAIKWAFGGHYLSTTPLWGQTVPSFLHLTFISDIYLDFTHIKARFILPANANAKRMLTSQIRNDYSQQKQSCDVKFTSCSPSLWLVGYSWWPIKWILITRCRKHEPGSSALALFKTECLWLHCCRETRWLILHHDQGVNRTWTYHGLKQKRSHWGKNTIKIRLEKKNHPCKNGEIKKDKSMYSHLKLPEWSAVALWYF